MVFEGTVQSQKYKQIIRNLNIKIPKFLFSSLVFYFISLMSVKACFLFFSFAVVFICQPREHPFLFVPPVSVNFRIRNPACKTSCATLRKIIEAKINLKKNYPQIFLSLSFFYFFFCVSKNYDISKRHFYYNFLRLFLFL